LERIPKIVRSLGKNILEIDTILSVICMDCKDLIQSYELIFITKNLVGNVVPKSFIEYKTEEELIFKNNTNDIKIDNIDINILEFLSENSTIPIYKIAQETNLSADAITYRIKKLQNSDFILGYAPAVNYNLINYSIYAVLISAPYLTQKEESTLKEFLRNNTYVLWAVKSIGKYNLIIYMCVEKIDDFIRATEDLRNFLIDKIKDYETLINVEEYKYTYLPKGLIQKA